MVHDPELVAETRAWMVRAANDLRAAEALQRTSPPLLDEAVFHCQQAAEKALKGFLTWHGQPFRKTHNLEEIGEQCLDVDAALGDLIDRATPLTEYAWKFRYPGDPEGIDEAEATEALKTARQVSDAILDRLPDDVRPGEEALSGLPPDREGGRVAEPDVQRIAKAVVRDLDLTPPSSLSSYQSVTFCLIDAVYSINLQYEQVKRVVERYWERYCKDLHLHLERHRNAPVPPPHEQDAVRDLLMRMKELGDERFAGEVFQHRGRTSPKSGILKAEAVRRFAQELADHGVEYLQDISAAVNNAHLEQAIRKIPGQRSGISLRYFFMEAGCEGPLKPDRMILGYIESVLQRKMAIDECPGLLTGAVGDLKAEFPHLTPRRLDGLIWQYQRRLGRKEAGSSDVSRRYAHRKERRVEGKRKFWEAIRELRRNNEIPKQWRIPDIAPLLRGSFADSTVQSVPYNQSETRDGKTKGDYVKKGRPAEAYRVGPGSFELINDPGS